VSPVPPAHWDGVLVRFGEIGIKSAPVRRAMVQRLRSNLLSALERRQVEGDVAAIGSRLWLSGPDPEALAAVAQRTFGVVSASPARRVEATLPAVAEAACALALERDWRTFAIRARREGSHPFSSQQLQVEVGSAVFRAAEAAGRSPKVDLGSPELAIDVDVRGPVAYVFCGARPGPGGIPVGTQGRVLVLLSDEASMLAAWMVMRRGCEAVAFHAGSRASLPGAFDELVRLGMDPVPEVTGPIPGKEARLAAAAEAARRRRATVLVTGETLESRLVAATIPVLRPVCGLDPAEFGRVRAQAGLGPVDHL
jgi:adenylyl- and sulfurtransferase ThiI